MLTGRPSDMNNKRLGLLKSITTQVTSIYDLPIVSTTSWWDSPILKFFESLTVSSGAGFEYTPFGCSSAVL